MSKFQFIVFLSLCSVFGYAESEKVQDLKLCQAYEFRGEMSKNLNDVPRLTTFGESGLSVELAVEPTEEIALNLIALKGHKVRAKAWVTKKKSARQYSAQIYFIELDQPQGVGAGKGNVKALPLKEKIKENCTK